MNKLIFFIFCVTIVSCNTDSSKKSKIEDRIGNNSDFIPEPDIDIRLKSEKMIIDSTIIKYRKPTRYVLFNENEKAKQVNLTERSLDEHENQFIIYSDSTNTIKAIREIPFSQSGDWHIEQTYYFDNQGKTFGIQKQFNTFQHDENCGGDNPIFVSTIQLYNKGKIIVRKEIIKDIKDRDITKDSCSYNKIEIEIYPNLTDLLKAAKIDLIENHK